MKIGKSAFFHPPPQILIFLNSKVKLMFFYIFATPYILNSNGVSGDKHASMCVGGWWIAREYDFWLLEE
jgi:hypothetical protein